MKRRAVQVFPEQDGPLLTEEVAPSDPATERIQSCSGSNGNGDLILFGLTGGLMTAAYSTFRQSEVH